MLRSTCAVAALLAAPAFAQPAPQMEVLEDPALACVLMTHDSDHRHAHEGAPTAEELDARVERWYLTTNPTTETVVTTGPSATFVVTYTGFQAFPDAQAAYQAAVDIWASYLTSNVPILVSAEFAELGPGVLGAAGPFLVRDFGGAPQTSTWYPTAMANAIAGVDLVPGSPDIQSRFSSNFTNWYFGLDGNPGPSQYDFRHVVLHELGHGLGFQGSGRVHTSAAANCGAAGTVPNGTGCWGRQAAGGFPQIFDLFVEDTQGIPMLDVGAYPNLSMELGVMLRSASVWASSERIAAAASPLDRAKLWAPATWQQGSSFSHWDENLYPRGTPNALMTPQVAPGESSASPGPLTCAFFGDMGWPLGPNCQALVSTEETAEATRAGALVVAGANPFATTTTLRLTLDAPQPVEVSLHDALGRRVRTLHDGIAPPGLLSVAVRADGLAPGVYVARAHVAGQMSNVRLVVTR